MPARTLPRLVVTLGMRGSASTYVFNVVRVMLANVVGPENLMHGLPMDAGNILSKWQADSYAVVKAHHLGQDLKALIWFADAPVFISLRDPRDAVVSVSQRFRVSFADALRLVALDAATIREYLPRARLRLHYEHGFHRNPLTPKTLGAQLGIGMTDTTSATLHKRFETDSIRRLAQSVETLPHARLKRNGGDVFDMVTHIHANHIGDGETGKWRHVLSPAEQAQVQERLGPFLGHFGYG